MKYRNKPTKKKKIEKSVFPNSLYYNYNYNSMLE